MKKKETAYAVLAPYKNGERIYRLFNFDVLLICADKAVAEHHCETKNGERVVRVKIEWEEEEK